MKREDLKAQLKAQQEKDVKDFAEYIKIGKKKFNCDFLPITFLNLEGNTHAIPVSNLLITKIDIQIINT